MIQFTIHGNQNDPEGNAVPYTRVVGQALWTAPAKRYSDWKQYVQHNFLVALDEKHRGICSVAIFHHKKPIILLNDQMAEMNIMIYWANELHGDPDNVWKGIADALFFQDKHIMGKKDFVHAEDKKGKVEISITMRKL